MMSRVSPETDASANASFGARIMALADRLAAFSETPEGLTCTYLSPAHRAVARELATLMADAGMAVETDAVGNVVGRYRSDATGTKTLILGSHYDTVRDAGKYDGRLGILTPLVVVGELARNKRRLPFHLELIAFAEEEGVRFSTSYIGSSAVAGRFDPALLARTDAAGTTLGDALRAAGFDPGAIPALARQPRDLLGYLEIHIEQGPALLNEDLPVGIVTAIAGNVRYAVTIEGEAGHAGTVPMALRHDAAAAAAEIVLHVERRCSAPGLVGTVGRLSVPDGAINVIPGRCEMSLDIRSGDDATRDAAVADILAEIDRVARRRGVTVATKELMRAPAVPCSPRLQEMLAAAIGRAGLPVRHLASGAGHDAVMFGGLTDAAMLFVRCGNGGVSHSPRETVTAGDADIAARILLDVLLNLKP
jgi:allantoate deiminase/N-carbamoyl-L-amino-acid hydrolase